VPDLIRDDLIFWALLHKADLLGLFALGQFIKLLSVKQDLPASSSVRRKHSFHLPQKRRFPTPGRAAEHQGRTGSGTLCNQTSEFHISRTGAERDFRFLAVRPAGRISGALRPVRVWEIDAFAADENCACSDV